MELGKAIVQMYPLSRHTCPRTGAATSHRQTSAGDHIKVGEWIIGALWGFFANCERAIDGVEKKFARDRQLIKQDFAI